jgi:hypothetical protein
VRDARRLSAINDEIRVKFLRCRRPALGSGPQLRAEASNIAYLDALSITVILTTIRDFASSYGAVRASSCAQQAPTADRVRPWTRRRPPITTTHDRGGSLDVAGRRSGREDGPHEPLEVGRRRDACAGRGPEGLRAYFSSRWSWRATRTGSPGQASALDRLHRPSW